MAVEKLLLCESYTGRELLVPSLFLFLTLGFPKEMPLYLGVYVIDMFLFLKQILATVCCVYELCMYIG